MSDCKRDGIQSCNTLLDRVEPLLTVKNLKDKWLFGVLPIIDEEGVELSDETLQSYIETAVSMLEHDLDIAITPREVCEEKDYFANDYYEWGFMQLNNIPVIEIVSMQVTYLRDAAGVPESVLDIPPNWVRFREHDGLVRLVPNNKFPANLSVGANGSWFPELFNRNSHVPQMWTVKYKHGFKDGAIPVMINMAIGLLASIMAMNIAGDLKLGSGIASQSLSIDGLSQSVNTTASAENHTYSAKVEAAYHQLFGDKGENARNRGVMGILRDYYQAQRMNII